jgi:RecA/RadA recombinase
MGFESLPKGLIQKLKSMGIHSIDDLIYIYQSNPAYLRESLTEQQYARVVKLVLANWKPNVLKAKQLKKKVAEKARISTGVLALDKVMGGGIREGTTAEFFGEFGSGKTHMAVTAMAMSYLPAGKGGIVRSADFHRTLWIDTENVSADAVSILENIFRERFGFNPDFFLDNYIDVLQLPDTNSLLATLAWLRENRQYRVIVIDSMAELLKEEFNDPTKFAERARVLKDIISHIKWLNHYGVTAVFTNHVYESPDPYSGGPRAYGGNIIGHFATYHIRLRNTNSRGTRYCDPKRATAYDVPGSKRVEIVFGTSSVGTVDWEPVSDVKPCEELPEYAELFREYVRESAEGAYPEEALL